MPLKAVLFDLWETLILDRPDRNRPRRAWRSGAVRDVLAGHGFAVEVESVSRALDASTLALTALHDSGRDIDWPARAEMFLSNLDLETGGSAPRDAASDIHEVIA